MTGPYTLTLRCPDPDTCLYGGSWTAAGYALVSSRARRALWWPKRDATLYCPGCGGRGTPA